MDTASRCLFSAPGIFKHYIPQSLSRRCHSGANVIPLYLRKFLSLLSISMVAGFLLSTLTIPTKAFGSDSIHEIPSITATRLDYNKLTDQPPRKSYITLTAQGMKVVNVADSDGHAVNQLIQDFNADVVWLVSVPRKQYVTLKLISHDDAVADPNASNPSGVLTTNPCTYGKGTKVGDAVWRGLRVESWSCQNENSIGITKQFYSSDWNLVVLEEQPNGDIAEIRDLKAIGHVSPHYKPDSRFTEVELDRFLSSEPLSVLGLYDEPDVH